MQNLERNLKMKIAPNRPLPGQPCLKKEMATKKVSVVMATPKTSCQFPNAVTAFPRNIGKARALVWSRGQAVVLAALVIYGDMIGSF